MPLLGLFCCNLDPDPDCEPDADFYQDGPRYTELTVMYHYQALFALKCHKQAYFAVIWIQIWICELDADFDQDVPRYTELTVMYHYHWALFALKCHYQAYLAVIRIQIRITAKQA